MPPPPKKRKLAKEPAPESITFDPSARETYLTGFHARKVARAKAAQEENVRRERAEKIRLRAEMRKQRKEDLEKHVEEVNRLVRQANGDVAEPESSSSTEDKDEEEDGEGDGEGEVGVEEIRIEDEYVDEDKYTTVTVESVGISREGFTHSNSTDHKGGGADEQDASTAARQNGTEQTKLDKKRVWTKQYPKSDKPKKKKKKFRYETKAERKVERVKQGMKKRKAAQARKDKGGTA